MNELATVARTITTARTYMDIFGNMCDGETAQQHVKHVYHVLARTVHPDRYVASDDKQMAKEAFQALCVFKHAADMAIKRSVYGTVSPRVTLRTRNGEHTVLSTLSGGDISATYETESNVDGTQVATFCKVAKRARDNDLVKNEAAALKRLHSDTAEEKWKRHVPVLYDSFLYDNRGKRLQANALTRLDGFYTLEQIKRVYPDGVSPLHAIWMFRRILMALGFSHDNGVVHGAIVPDHVMILPQEHGVVLVDWCYASIAKDGIYPPIAALARGYREWYPEEVFAKDSPSPATDIAMAVRCVIYILGGNPVTAVMPKTVPKRLRTYLRGCLQARQTMRPQNAWLLLQEFDDLLETMGSPYYPRKFRQFTMPSGVV